ncbi:MAG: YtxH protein [Mucilaginibacter sp.]|nr:YtxH protein [Mucilaginibacter sp.]
MKDQTKIIAALLVGAAAGAALGLLLAPDSGERLRGDIAEYVDELVGSAKDKAQSTMNDLKEYGSNAVDKAKSKFSDQVEEAKDYGNSSVNDAKSKVKATANDMNNSVQQA